jgi:hypothetical protein
MPVSVFTVNNKHQNMSAGADPTPGQPKDEAAARTDLSRS